MDSARSWLQKFQPRDKLRASTRNKDDTNGTNEIPNVPMDDTSLSNVTKQKVTAAKQYIENHYKEQMRPSTSEGFQVSIFYDDEDQQSNTAARQR